MKGRATHSFRLTSLLSPKLECGRYDITSTSTTTYAYLRLGGGFEQVVQLLAPPAPARRRFAFLNQHLIVDRRTRCLGGVRQSCRLPRGKFIEESRRVVSQRSNVSMCNRLAPQNALWNSGTCSPIAFRLVIRTSEPKSRIVFYHGLRRSRRKCKPLCAANVDAAPFRAARRNGCSSVGVSSGGLCGC
jgi:hypothetical protein